MPGIRAHLIVAAAVVLLMGCSARPMSTVPALSRDSTSPNDVKHYRPSAGSPELIVTLPSANQVAAIDPATKEIISIRSVGFSPYLIVADPNRSWAWTTSGAGMLTAIDPELSARESISVPLGITKMSIDPAGNRIYALSSDGNSVSVVSIIQETVINTLTLHRTATDIALSPSTRQIFAASPSSDEVDAINIDTGRQVRRVAIGGCNGKPCQPQGLIASTDGHYVLALSFRKTIVAIDATTNSVVAKIPVGGHQDLVRFLGLNAVYQVAYFFLSGSAHDYAEGVSAAPPFAITDEINLPKRGQTYGIAFDPSGNQAFVTYTQPPEIVGHGLRVFFPSSPYGIALVK